MKVLVTAANGKTGRLVIGALRRRPERVTVRAFARSPVALADADTEVIIGDHDDPAARARAMEGADVAIHYGPPVDPRETAIGTGMIDAAVSAGVGRFIFISVIHPHIEELPNHLSKLAVEQYLINAGIDWTVVRPQHFMQNVDVAAAVASGEVAMPYAPDRVLGHVDLADVAEAAVKVALEPGHSCAAYDADGDQNFSGNQLSDAIGRISGRPVRYRQITVSEQIERRMAGKVPTNYTIDGYHRVCAYYARHGMRANSNVLTWLLGRPPTSFEAFVRRNLEAAG